MDWQFLGFDDQLEPGVIYEDSRLIHGVHDRGLDWQGKNVLEIGCGEQTRKADIVAAGGNYTGTDAFDSSGADVLCDAVFLPFLSASFDVVLMRNVVEHFKDPDSALQEVNRVLRPGGLLDSSQAFMQPFHGISYCHFSHLGLGAWLERAGFKLIRLQPSRVYGIETHLRAMFYHFDALTRGWVLSLLGRVFRFGLDKYLDIIELFVVRREQKKGMGRQDAVAVAKKWRMLEALRYTATLNFIAEKK